MESTSPLAFLVVRIPRRLRNEGPFLYEIKDDQPLNSVAAEGYAPHELPGPGDHGFPQFRENWSASPRGTRLRRQGQDGSTYFLSFATSPRGVVCLPFRSELWRGIASRGSELSSGFVGGATPQVRGCLGRVDSVLVRRKMC